MIAKRPTKLQWAKMEALPERKEHDELSQLVGLFDASLMFLDQANAIRHGIPGIGYAMAAIKSTREEFVTRFDSLTKIIRKKAGVDK